MFFCPTTPCRGKGSGGILYTIRGSTPSYTHYNNRGDVVAKTNASGALTYEAAYEAYGKRTAEQGSTDDRQKANTKDEDPTGLLNEGFRYRDLETGTFITRDPLMFVDGPNMYAYVVQNPWTCFDPEGLKKKKDHEKDIDEKSSKRAKIQERRDEASAEGKNVRALDKKLGKLDKEIGEHKEAIATIEASAKFLKTVADQLGKDFDESKAVNELDDSWSSFKDLQGFRQLGATPFALNYANDLAYSAYWEGMALATGQTLARWTNNISKAYYASKAASGADEMATVSRWGREGLEAGDFVMQGPATKMNYWKSGKWQPGMGNQKAAFEAGQEFTVPKSSLGPPSQAATATVFDKGPFGMVKSLLGQKSYNP